MKKLIFLFSLLFLSHIVTFSQVCPAGDVTFNTQEQIDEFQCIYPECKAIAGNMTIFGNNITNLDGLDGLLSVEGNMCIGCLVNGGNPLLPDLTGLDNLKLIEGNLVIAFNNSLTSLEGLGSLTTIGGDLQIRCNSSLNNLNGLEHLANIGGALTLENNAALTTLTALNSLNSAGGGLYIGYNPHIISLEGLNNLTSSGAEISVYFNNQLATLHGLEGLTVTEALYILGNNALTSLSGLANLTEVRGSLWIGGVNPQSGNTSLDDLLGLTKLISVGKNLVINYNESLESITGLSHLKAIGGKLLIHGNDRLTSLSGLDSIDAGSIHELEITHNNSLSICEINNICSFLSHPTSEVIIEDNSKGCNSLEEVKSACGFNSTGEMEFTERVFAYPNPCNDVFYLNFNLPHQSKIKAEIFNTLGEKIIELPEQFVMQGNHEFRFDISSVPAGICFCRFFTDHKSILIRIIKH